MWQCHKWHMFFYILPSMWTDRFYFITLFDFYIELTFLSNFIGLITEKVKLTGVKVLNQFLSNKWSLSNLNLMRSITAFIYVRLLRWTGWGWIKVLTDTRFCGVWVPLEFLRSTAEKNQLISNFRSPLIDSRS